MTDDYLLFEDREEPPDGGPPVDPDVALISAYLARELSPVQVVAVERRLASDAAFAEAVRPILEAWSAPITAPVEPVRAGWDETLSTLVTRPELAAGWARHIGAVDAERRQARARRASTYARAAVIFAAVLIPVIGLAQAVEYVSQVDAPPGTTFGQKAIAVLRGARRHVTSAVPPVAPPSDSLHTDFVGATGVERVSTTAKPRSGADAQLPPIRPLGPIEARFAVALHVGQPSVMPSIRQLSDGRVLLTDRTARRLLLFDSSLANPQVIIDPVTTNPTQRPDQGRPPAGQSLGTLMPFAGDSTLFVNFAGTGYTVIDAHGEMGRTIAGAGPVGTQGRVLFPLADAIDQTGHFLIRPTTETARRLPYPNDTLPLLRLGPETRQDTVGSRSVWPVAGWYATKEAVMTWVKVPPKRDLSHLDATPLPVNDDWAMLADGSVAVIRAADFHIDWFEPNGTHRSTGRIPFDWVRLTPERKQRLIDSLQAYYVAHPASGAFYLPDGTPTTMPPIGAVSTLPDSIPPFGGSTAIGDLDLHVWIRVFVNGELPDALGPDGDHTAGRPVRPPLYPLPSLRPPMGPSIYYVIDKSGAVVDRVQLPVGWRPLAFGPRGKVYLIRAKSAVEWEIARARLR